MKALVEHADQQGWVLALTPTSDWGSSKPRLTRFYERFGFTGNGGSRADYTTRETMLREPAPTRGA